MESNHQISEFALTCENFEDFNSAILGWSTDFRQVEPGRAQVELRHRMTPGINAMDVSFSHSTASMGSTARGYRTFGMPDGVVGCSWCGSDVNRTHILRFDAHDDFSTFTPGGFIGRTLSVEDNLLAGIAEQLGFPDFLGGLDRGKDILTVDPRAVEAFRQTYDRAKHNSLELRETVESLVLLLESAKAKVSPAQSKPSRTVDRALALIRDRAKEAISVAEVCEATGVSYRTLDRAFKQRLGFGPKSCILTVRLQGARNELQTAATPVLVADIANAWGFWHMGDFARRYHREFGELPSATLGEASSSLGRRRRLEMIG